KYFAERLVLFRSAFWRNRRGGKSFRQPARRCRGCRLKEACGAQTKRGDALDRRQGFFAGPLRGRSQRLWCSLPRHIRASATELFGAPALVRQNASRVFGAVA